jgi:hypothetical protein
MADELIYLEDRSLIQVLDPKVGTPTEVRIGGEQGLPGPIGMPGVGGELVSVDITITAQMVLDKALTLPKEVFDASGFFLSVFSGLQQREGVDFVVTSGSDQLTWDALALELLLEEGDIIHVRYIFN